MRILHRHALTPIASLLLRMARVVQALVNAPHHHGKGIGHDGECERAGREVAFPKVGEG